MARSRQNTIPGLEVVHHHPPDNSLIENQETVSTQRSTKNDKPSSQISSRLRVRRPPLHNASYAASIPHDDASRIRRRYLYRLGIQDPAMRHNDRCSHRDSTPLHQIPPPTFTVDLKCDDKSKDHSHKPDVPIPSTGTSHKNAIVSFHSRVTVREIPSRHAYSRRIQHALWVISPEYEESVHRNVLEYMSEGCRPENVLDEKDFFWHKGRLVHPAYFSPDYAQVFKRLRRQPLVKPGQRNQSRPTPICRIDQLKSKRRPRNRRYRKHLPFFA